MMSLRIVSARQLRFAEYACILLCLICPLAASAETPVAADIAELRELQLEVRSLRDDVRRLSELLEKQLAHRPPHQGEANKADASKLTTPSENHLPTEIQAALQTKVTIDFTDAPLNRVIREICRMANVSCLVDQTALSADGVNVKELISIEVREVSAKSALNLVLRPRNLTFFLEDEVLKITSIRRANGSHRPAVSVNTYGPPVMPLKEWKLNPFWLDFGRVLGVDSKPTNGPESIIVEPRLSTRAPIPAHLKTKQTPPNRPVRRRSEGKLEQALLKNVSLSFNEASLLDVVREIKQLGNVNIVIDEAGLAEVGIRNDDRVSIEVDQVTIRSALISLLRPINLSFVNDDDVLKITSRERAKGQLLSSTYSVSDLITPLVEQAIEQKGTAATSRSDHEKFYLRRLRRFIISSVSCNSWEDVGGRGSIECFQTTQSLAIRQSAIVHDEIVRLLEELRRVNPLSEDLRQPQDSELVVNNYNVADLVLLVSEPFGSHDQVTTADWLKLVDRITSQIEPDEWSSNGGAATIQVFEQTQSLVINATPSMHESISEMFGEMRREAQISLTFATSFLPALSDADLEQSGLKFEFEGRSRMTRISQEEAGKLSELAIKVGREQILCVPKITSPDGVMASINSNINGEDVTQPRIELHLRGHVSDDRRSLRLGIALNPESLVNDLLANSYRLDDGDYLLLDLTERQLAQRNHPKTDKGIESNPDPETATLPTIQVTKSRVFVLVQPRIVVQEEEEELLDVSSKKTEPK